MSSNLLAVLICYVSMFGIIQAQTEGELRLIDGFSSSRGRLEIYLRGEWGTVCDDGFDITDAGVACRQLGFAGALRTDTATDLGYSSGSSFSPIWLDEVECSSSTRLLVTCSHSGIGLHDCSHSEDVGVLCDSTLLTINEGDLRLVNSFSTRGGAGRLEIFLRGEWGTVCDTNFGSVEGDVACRQLGYDSATDIGNVISLGYPVTFFDTWLDNVQCSTSDTTLLSCDHNGVGITSCFHSADVALECSLSVEGQLRLVDTFSTTGSSGRLEIFLRGEWGTVCDDGFGQTEGDVACQQLGYNSASRVGNVIDLNYPEASFSTEIWLDNVDCSFRTGSDLLSCDRNTIGNHDCNHDEDVALQCSFSFSGTSSSVVGGIIGGVIALLFLVCFCIPVCVACIYYNSRNGRRGGARRERIAFQSAPATVTTTTTTTTAAQPPAPYPTAAAQPPAPYPTSSTPYAPPQAQQAPPPHPANQPQQYLPQSRLQEAPPPSYDQAAAYPPSSYRTSVQGGVAAPYPQQQQGYPPPAAAPYPQPQNPVYPQAYPPQQPLNPGYPQYPPQGGDGEPYSSDAPSAPPPS